MILLIQLKITAWPRRAGVSVRFSSNGPPERNEIFNSLPFENAIGAQNSNMYEIARHMKPHKFKKLSLLKAKGGGATVEMGFN
jgi:hypothetical protein